METTALEKQVSEEVRAAAKAHADRIGLTAGSMLWKAMYYSFIDGALFMKPIEHNQQPINGYGKESENNQNSIQEQVGR